MYLEKLSNAFGVSSVEDDVRKIIIEAAKPYADAWQVDTMGNLFVERSHRGELPTKPLRVMITAHMDEVGFMISEIKGSGQLKFKSIGGFDPRVLLGKRVRVGKEQILGVIGLKPVHLLSRGDHRRVGSIDSMYIDVGAESDSISQVKLGDFATFATRFGYLGGLEEQSEQQGIVKGKAFDNRAGCAIILELLKRDYPIDLIAVFTVQEELGLRGAKVAAYKSNPDLAFILECTAADDLPTMDEKAEQGFPKLGAGPAITVMDRSFIADRRLVDLLTDTAESEGIPYQFKRPGVGGTDAGAVHLSREGIPSAAVSLAARYIHSPATILDLADFWHSVDLMAAALMRLPDQI